MEGIVTGLIAALVGGVSGYVSAFLTNFIERRKVIDESVRTVRTETYAFLWRKTALLPKWPRAEHVTYRDVLRLSEEFREWYFGTLPTAAAGQMSSSQSKTPNTQSETPESAPHAQGPGGMYLSASARGAYGRLQDQITQLVKQERAAGLDRPLSTPDYDALQSKASRLRTEMTRDLLSRRRTFMVR
ncbi:MAG TPA: hypothetical protein VE754_01910 [Actinomycetota bacterium]|nr:hypothetical protein [Actinomycetota bacterium]